MQATFDKIKEIDMDGCNISIEESASMIRFFSTCLSELRGYFLSLPSISQEEEIVFFKEMKPEILGFLLYFNKIHNIELKCPIGSDTTQKEYYENELRSLTFFFERHIDFYQYYRSKSTHLDEYYFLRGRYDIRLCVDSSHYILDTEFSTGYDYKIAKILANEMLRIYLNKKIQHVEKQLILHKNKSFLPSGSLKWTGSKVDAIELGYGLFAIGTINHGHTSIKEIMAFIEAAFDIDLGDYYRTYITIKNRKKDRTAFFSSIMAQLQKRMDADDM